MCESLLKNPAEHCMGRNSFDRISLVRMNDGYQIIGENPFLQRSFRVSKVSSLVFKASKNIKNGKLLQRRYDRMIEKHFYIPDKNLLHKIYLSFHTEQYVAI